MSNQSIHSTHNACQHREQCRLVEQQRDELLAVLLRIRALPQHSDAMKLAQFYAEQAMAKAKEGA